MARTPLSPLHSLQICPPTCPSAVSSPPCVCVYHWISPHRTLDPEEAHFFYVLVYSTCQFDLDGKNYRARWPDVKGKWEREVRGPSPLSYSAPSPHAAAINALRQGFPCWHLTSPPPMLLLPKVAKLQCLQVTPRPCSSRPPLSFSPAPPHTHTGAESGPRPMQAHNMILAVQRWIEEAHPRLWQRRGGRDHIWLMAHDEGACYAPRIVWPGERERGGGAGRGGEGRGGEGRRKGEEEEEGGGGKGRTALKAHWCNMGPIGCGPCNGISPLELCAVGFTIFMLSCRHHAVPLGPTGLPSQVPHPVLRGTLGGASVTDPASGSFQALPSPRPQQLLLLPLPPGQLLQGPCEQGVAAGRLGQ